MKITVVQIERFLREVDATFPVPLSQKQDLHEFAIKLFERATVCCVTEQEEIAAMVAGYTDHLTDNMAYISIVATRGSFQGRGYAARLIGEFMEICRQKEVDAVHLYVVPSNLGALRLYEKMGFVPWQMPNETRPSDLHMIYYFGDKKR